MESVIKYAIVASGSKNQADFADKLGVTRSLVAHWKSGNRQVTPEMAKRIELLTNGAVNRGQLNDVFL